MGSRFSKEKTEPSSCSETKSVSKVSVKSETTSVSIGTKRSAPVDQAQPEKKSKKKFKKKETWGQNKPKTGVSNLQTRPERLGPKEPRVPKKKVALLVGFNGTGYQGMQL
jgi:tRNA pseudouridine38-40 synthase